MADKKNYAESKKTRERACLIYPDIVSAYEEKTDQSKKIDKYWDIFGCKLNSQQQYDGDSQVYVPIVHDCIEAAVKRYTSMLMPTTGKCIDIISESGDIPYATIAILEHYLRHCRLRTLLPGLFRRGEVEGQWSLMLDWKSSTRKTRRKIIKEDPDNVLEEIEDMEDVKIVTAGPEITVIAAQDLAIIPATSACVNDAEMVVVALRLSKSKMDEMVDEGTFLRSQVDLMAKGVGDKKWADKERASEAGVRIKAGSKYYLVYMAWMKFKVEDEKEPCIIYFGGENIVLGIEKNPYWSGKVPILSEPVDLIPGSIWGKSKIAHVEQLQYQTNDAVNMGMDSAKYSVLPIVMTDPVKNPNVGSMVLAAAAIWETSPADTQFAQFPALWKDAFGMVAALKSQISESMGVNDALMGKSPAGRKNAQAIAQQEQAAMATISDPVRRFETGIMDNLLEWFFELDQQFRDDDLVIRTEGDVGINAKMQRIPPQQFTERYYFKWNGVEQTMGAQRVQQMIGFLNVLRGMPPQTMNGRSIDATPIIDYASEVIFGPNIAPRVIVDNRNKMTVAPDIENEILHNGMDVMAAPMDDDMMHLQSHQEAARVTGDPAGHFRKHIMMHMAQAQAKAQASAPQPPKGLPGQPGMPQGQPGSAGTPRPGAMPAGPRTGAQQPAGSIHQDSMGDASSGMRG
jgi:hypothetical protein